MSLLDHFGYQLTSKPPFNALHFHDKDMFFIWLRAVKDRHIDVVSNLKSEREASVDFNSRVSASLKQYEKDAEGNGGLNHLKDLINEGLPYNCYTDLLDLIVPGSEGVAFPNDLPVIGNCEDVLGGASGEAESSPEGVNDHGNEQGLNLEFNMSGPSEGSKPRRRKRGRRTKRTKRSATAPKRRCLSDDNLNRKSALVPRAPLLMYHRGKGYNSRITQAESAISGSMPSENVNPSHDVVSDPEAPPPSSQSHAVEIPSSQSHAVEMSLDEGTTQSESDGSETESDGPLSPNHQ